MKMNHLLRLAAIACLGAATFQASADVVYKCGKGAKVVYQDAPCKPGGYRDNVLTARNSKGSMTFVAFENGQTPGSRSLPALEIPRYSDQDLLVLEERQRFLGKPPIKEQLAVPTAIESRVQVVWNNVKQWFRSAFQ
jgi:hypothetical protein